MEKFSYILTTYLVQKGVIVADKSCIYQYGFQVGLEVSINTAISILIAVLCHMERETIVFFAVFIVLRSYAGGLHLKTYLSCLICSCMSLLGLLLIVKYIEINNLISMGLICISLVLIKILSPVQDINRPLSASERIRFGRKLNFAIVGIVVISIIFYFMQLKRMLWMVSVTTTFTVVILVLGKVNYEKCVKKLNSN